MKNKRGDAMLVVICVLAVFMALCLSVLLAVGSSVSSADGIVQEEQSRVLATTLSRQVEELLTGAEENELRTYVQDNIWTASWPYYNADEWGHGAYGKGPSGQQTPNAYRDFTLSGDALPAGASCRVILFWEADSEIVQLEHRGDVILAAEVHCTFQGRESVIRSEFTPAWTEGEETQDSWSWVLSWRE